MDRHENPRPSPTISGRRRLLLTLAEGSTALAVLGVVVRFTVRDAWVPASTIYYAIPLPVMALLFFVAALAWWQLKCPKRSLVLALGALLTTVGIWQYGFARGKPVAGAADAHGHRAIFWNISRGIDGWEGVFRRIRQADAEIVASVEACSEYATDPSRWRRELDDYELSSMDGQMLVACRGSLLSEEMRYLGRHMGILKHCHVQCRNGDRIHVLLVDILSDPFRSRKAALHDLDAYVQSLQGEPCLIVGDFNTPLDSIYFAPWRKHCTHAIESTARGYAATWPVPVPLLQIDHMWGNSGIQFLRTSQIATAWSDHKLIECDFTLRSATNSGTERVTETHVVRTDLPVRTN